MAKASTAQSVPNPQMVNPLEAFAPQQNSPGQIPGNHPDRMPKIAVVHPPPSVRHHGSGPEGTAPAIHEHRGGHHG